MPIAKPAADDTVAHWKVAPAGEHWQAVSAPDDADYVINTLSAGFTSTPLIFLLDTPIGLTSSCTVNIRAKVNLPNAGRIGVTLLDSYNDAVSETVWTKITSTGYLDYTLSPTTNGTATKIKIEANEVSRLMVLDPDAMLQENDYNILLEGKGVMPLNWNPDDKGSRVILSADTSTATIVVSDGSYAAVRAVLARNATNNYYYVIEMGSTNAVSSIGGIGNLAANLNGYVGQANSYGYTPSDNFGYANAGPALGAGAFVPAHPTIVGVEVDFDLGKITFKRGGKYYDVSYSFTPNTMLYPMWGVGTGVDGTYVGTINTGATAFMLGLPDGALPWTGTWNSSDKHGSIVLSNGNLTAAATNSGTVALRGTHGWDTGRRYFEITRGTSDLVLAGLSLPATSLAEYPGSNSTSWGYYFQDNTKYYNSVITSMPNQKSTIKMGVHLNAGVVYIYGDGTKSQQLASGLTGLYYPMWGSGTADIFTLTGKLYMEGDLPWKPAGATSWAQL